MHPDFRPKFREETKMKKRFLILLLISAFAFNLPISAQTKFDDFWTKFKTAVKAKNKTAVAALTKFPMYMPYGQSSVKNKAQLISRYDKIFKGETDAVKCFAKEKPERENAKRYYVACGFEDGSDNGDKPIVYTFELTKTGWKFVGLDNINE